MSNPQDVTVELSLSKLLRISYAVLLGLGALLVLIGFSSEKFGLLVTACFLGIASRIVQAESHFRDRSGVPQ